MLPVTIQFETQTVVLHSAMPLPTLVQHVCERCDAAFSSDSDLSTHRQWRHSGGFSFASSSGVSKRSASKSPSGRSSCNQGTSSTKKSGSSKKQARWTAPYGEGIRLGGQDAADIPGAFPIEVERYSSRRHHRAAKNISWLERVIKRA